MIFQIIVFAYFYIGVLLSAVFVFSGLYYSVSVDWNNAISILLLWPAMLLLFIIEMMYGGIGSVIG